MKKIAPHTPAAHTASYDRLMRLADPVLAALEIAPRPATAIQIGRMARAIVAFERMLRALYTPLPKTRSKPAKEPVRPKRPFSFVAFAPIHLPRCALTGLQGRRQAAL